MDRVKPRSNRKKVECLECKKVLNKDNKAIHVKSSHKGINVRFREIPDTGQKTLNFVSASKGVNILDTQNNNLSGWKEEKIADEEGSEIDLEANEKDEENLLGCIGRGLKSMVEL